MPEVWYAIPSANPELCARHLPAWRERGYRVAVLQNRVRADIPADAVVWSDTYPGWAGSVNELCARVVPRSADIVVTGGDDMLPEPSLSAEQIAESFFERFPDGFGVMQPVGDTFMNTHEYCGSPWLGRAWVDRAYGGAGPMPPGYAHNWADHELRWVAEAMGVLWQRVDLAQEHAHFSRAGAEPPEYWKAAVSGHDRADVEHFLSRLWAGFPGHEAGARRVEPDWWRERYDGVAFRHWASRYGARWLSHDAEERLRTALEWCGNRGYERVGIFGGGTATRDSGGALREPPVEICCVIDEHPSMRGGRLWGYPIVNLAEAGGMGCQAVIVHVRSGDGPIATRAREVLGDGVRVLSSHDIAAGELREETVHG